MPNLNQVMLMGNMTRDPEVKYTPSAKAIAEFGLAINHNWTTEQGEKRQEVTFVDVTFWGKQAEVLSQYCKKGHPIFVQGRLKLDTWEDKQTGQKRSKLSIVGESFQFLKQKGDDSQGQSDHSAEYDQTRRPQQQQRQQQPARNQRPAGGSDAPLDMEEQDDIPF